MTGVLLTGATGFIGRHCLERLRREGYDEVHAVSRRAQDAEHGPVWWHVADLRDPAQAAGLVARLRPSHLLHCAWIATPGRYRTSAENMDWLSATLALARAFGAAGGRRFVGVGSSAEYGARDDACREDETPIAPTSLYGLCKASCWLAVEAAGRHYGFQAAWGRVFVPYGPGDPPQRLIPSVLAALRAGAAVTATHGRQVRDFIFVADVADLLVRLLVSSAVGAFNIGSGQGVAVRTVIERLADSFGRRDLLKFGAVPFPEDEPMTLVAGMDKTTSALGPGLQTSLAAGLARVLAEPMTPALSSC